MTDATQDASWPLVLAVDDTPADLELLARILQQAEYALALAHNGPEALVLAAQQHPDLILLDVLMPDMNGLEVCRRLKADPATRGIPVIFITGQGTAEEMLDGFEAGAVDYVTKPFRIRELMARVNVHMELQRAGREIRILHGILPTCAHCKKIRNEQGQWQVLESYITEHSEAQFSHGLCPECIPAYFPDAPAAALGDPGGKPGVT